MRVRPVSSAPVVELGQITVSSRKRTLLILSVPALSLLLPGLAVEVASTGGPGQLTRVAAAIAQFLLFYSGVFALVALTAAVAAGLLATDRLVLTPERRILAQALHRAFSLIGISALANHILVEILASRAGIVDGFVPFLASRNTVYLGLGTLSSDLFVLVIVTGVLRRRFATGGRPTLWRWLHLTAYVAWPLAVLHGLLAGRSAKPYVDWSYGACLAAVALALTVRYVILHRGRNAATDREAGRTAAPVLAPSALPGSPSVARARPDVLGPARPAGLVRAAPRGPATPVSYRRSWSGQQEPPSGPLRALPSEDPAWAGFAPRPPRWEGAPWCRPDPADPDEVDAGIADQDGWAAPPAGGWER